MYYDEEQIKSVEEALPLITAPAKISILAMIQGRIWSMMNAPEFRDDSGAQAVLKELSDWIEWPIAHENQVLGFALATARYINTPPELVRDYGGVRMAKPGTSTGLGNDSTALSETTAQAEEVEETSA